MGTCSKNTNLKSSQGGFTIMEVMVSVTLSLIVTLAMLVLMSNTLGNTSRIVNMTKRSAMSKTACPMYTCANFSSIDVSTVNR